MIILNAPKRSSMKNRRLNNKIASCYIRM